MLLPRSGKVGLKWRFEKGSTLRYEMTRSMQMDMGGRGKHGQMTLFGMKMEIKDVRDGVAAFKVTCDRIKLVTSGLMESEYDSETDEQPDDGDPMARVMAALVGKSFELRLEDTGQVREVKGFSEMMAGILKDIRDETGRPSHLEEQFNDDQLQGMLQTAFPRLPEEPVAEGAIWKAESILSIHRLGEAAAKSRSKITAIKGNAADFKTRTILEIGEGDNGGMHGSLEIWHAAAEGKSTWDAEHGRLTESKTETKIIAETHGQEFEMLITSTMKWAPEKGH